jgi:hypothetical protein
MTPSARIVVYVCVILAGAIGIVFALRKPSDTPPTNPVVIEPPHARFTDVTELAGIRFRHSNGADGRKLLPETMGSGVAVLDYDRDGHPDLFFVNSCPWPGRPMPKTGRPTQALYRNRGDGTFDDVTAAAGLDIMLFGMSVAVGDYDNDGWPDLFVAGVGGNRLFHNIAATNGARAYRDVTASSGLAGGSGLPAITAEAFHKWNQPLSFPGSATWFDYDLDGKPDLFVCQYLRWSPSEDLGIDAVLPNGVRAYVPPTRFGGVHGQLFRNLGDGRFTDVSAATGIHVFSEGPGDRMPLAKALGVIVCDPDADGWPDLAVSCDTERNLFFQNVPGPDGTRQFREIGLYAGVALAGDARPRGGMGIDAGEIASAPAIVIANFSNEPASLFHRVRTQPLLFSDRADALQLAAPSRMPMKFGSFFFDYDLDGRLDLLFCNGHLEPDIAAAGINQTHAQHVQLFRQTDDDPSRFALVKWINERGEAPAPLVGRGCAYFDYDGDGDLDIVVTENHGPARVFRNDAGRANAFVRFVLEGGGPGMNRDAVGAVVEIESAGRIQRTLVAGARGYFSQCERTVTFGLGSNSRVDRVTVRWPTRERTQSEWLNLEGGATYRLSPGLTRPERMSGKP